MQKLGLNQSLQQKLSPQQIQFIKLLQVPTAELEGRIEEELEINPALEEGEEQERVEESNNEAEAEPSESEEFQEQASKDEDVDIKDYLQDDDYSGYKMQGDGDGDEENREMPIPMSSTLHEQLMSQLDFLGLDEKPYSIGKQLVGSIESDGYIQEGP